MKQNGDWPHGATSTDNTFDLGNVPSIFNQYASTWQGVFPIKKEPKDGLGFIAPVKSYPLKQHRPLRYGR